MESADTSAEHEALARYYRAKAADAKALAQHHRSMELAAQYEELAKGEDAAAKK